MRRNPKPQNFLYAPIGRVLDDFKFLKTWKDR